MIKKIKPFSQRIFVGITGRTECYWKSKLAEIEKLKIREAALFLERFDLKQRKKIYAALSVSHLKKIPMIHIKNDMERWELEWLAKKYDNPFFTIHEDGFVHMHKWRGFYKKLFLELNYNNKVAPYVNVAKVGGFCIDLSHFKSAEERWAKEFEYVLKRKKTARFACNHLNGYSVKQNRDLHKIKSLKEFDYLTTLPHFIFSDVIGIEAENSIAEQLEFKKYLVKMLNSAFGKKYS